MATITESLRFADTTGGSTIASSAFTPDADKVMVVFVYISGTATSPLGLTSDAGLTFDHIMQETVISIHEMAVFVSNELTTNVSQTLTADCTGDAGTGCIIHAMLCDGFEDVGTLGSAIVRQSGSVSDTSSSASVTLGMAPQVPNPGMMFVGDAVTTPAATAPSGFSGTADLGHASPAAADNCFYKDSALPTTATCGGTSSLYGAFYLELDLPDDIPLGQAVM